jgi:hypothetical protein
LTNSSAYASLRLTKLENKGAMTSLWYMYFWITLSTKKKSIIGCITLTLEIMPGWRGHDPLFPWLSFSSADNEVCCWFVSGCCGDDLVFHPSTLHSSPSADITPNYSISPRAIVYTSAWDYIIRYTLTKQYISLALGFFLSPWSCYRAICRTCVVCYRTWCGLFSVPNAGSVGLPTDMDSVHV